MLSRLQLYLALIIYMLFLPGVRSIDIGFSAQDGGASVGISDDYQLDDSVSVNEGAEAKFGNLEMNDNRAVGGTGDMSLTQNMVGSGGYVGQSIVNAASSTGSIVNDAHLLPSAMNAQQTANVEGQEVYAELNLRNRDCNAYTYSHLFSGFLDASQSISTGSAIASQNTYMNAINCEAKSTAITYTNYGSVDLGGFTQIWLTDGDLMTMQQASAESGLVNLAQNAYLSSSYFGGGSQTVAENHFYEYDYNHNFAGTANQGSGGINLQIDQQAEANELNSYASQQLTAETYNNQISYVNGISEGDWILSAGGINRRGAWISNTVYGPNSILNFNGNANSDIQITEADFDSSQIGDGDVSGVAGYFWSNPAATPLNTITPVPGFSISPWWPTFTFDQLQGYSIESSDGAIRDVQVI